MKQTFLLISTLLMTFSASAQMPSNGNEKLDTLCQTKFTAVYQYTINTTDENGEAVTDSARLALQVGDGVWKTWAYERYLMQVHRDEELGWDKSYFMKNEALMHIATTTVGYPEGKTVTLESVPPHQYEVTEDTEKPTWNMTEGSDSICGYLCQKANGEFRGKKWNVMYTEEIPAAAGPWKLQGLPGLIAYATDSEGTHTFRLIALYQESVPITYSSGSIIGKFNTETLRMENVFVPYEKSTREQMLKQKKNLFGNRMYLNDPMFYITGPKQIVVTYGKAENYNFIGGLFVPAKGHKYQPLDLE